MAPCRWLLLAMLAALAATPAAQPTRFTIAMIENDGDLVPFAAYDDGRWQQAWPDAAEAFSPEPTFENTPSVWRRHGQSVPTLWYLWRAGSRAPTQARITGIQAVESGCVKQVVLTTAAPAIRGTSAEDLGVAVDTDQRITPIEAVPREDPAWLLAREAIVQRFPSLERHAQTDELRIPSEMPTPVIQMTELYREWKSERSPLYFVAEKRYRTARGAANAGAQCPAETIVAGWLIHSDAGHVTVRAASVFLTACDGEAVVKARPLAGLHLAGRRFWVLRESGYEDSTYVVAEIGRSVIRHRLRVYGGGC